MHIETVAVHAGHRVDPSTGAVAAPIVLSTTFERAADGSYPRGFVYSRSDNPNRHDLEAALAALEGGKAAAAFASGLGAAAAFFQTLQPGDQVVSSAATYHGMTKLLREVLIPWGLDIAFVDMTDLDAVRAAISPRTKIVAIETPSNPQLAITDLRAVAGIAHECGALCFCDNTWAPIVQRPFEHGADFILHSTTKYIGGHSDVTGGAIVAREENALVERLRLVQGTAGAVPSPFDAWLTLRGIRTLPWRMRAHSENALQVARFLSGHPAVERVNYPGLTNDPGHAIAAAQMSGFGGMLSFLVKGGGEAARAVTGKVRIFLRATSLGGVESLIEHRATVAGESAATPAGLLRCSIGLEHPDDLIADLEQALG